MKLGCKSEQPEMVTEPHCPCSRRLRRGGCDEAREGDTRGVTAARRARVRKVEHSDIFEEERVNVAEEGRFGRV